MKAVLALGLTVFTIITGVWMLRPEPAAAPSPAESQWTEPYGGCKEAADYPGSPGYIDCVEHGWNPPAR